jgi:predicted O-methyltransferase YrrM
MPIYVKKMIEQGIWLSKMTEQAAWGLTDIITDLGPRVKGIEIGVQWGSNSFMLMDACPNIVKIVGIDPFTPYQDWDRECTEEEQAESYAAFLDNHDLMKDKFELFKEKSWDVADQFADGSFDFVFIDGDHSVRAVLKDLDAYAPKVRKGGIIAGHDIGLSGVNMAVTSWCKHQGIPLNKVHLIENQAWYWIKE